MLFLDWLEHLAPNSHFLTDQLLLPANYCDGAGQPAAYLPWVPAAGGAGVGYNGVAAAAAGQSQDAAASVVDGQNPGGTTAVVDGQNPTAAVVG